jgi:hypothetical protein
MTYTNLFKTRELAEKDIKQRKKAHPGWTFKIQRVTIGSNYFYAVFTT